MKFRVTFKDPDGPYQSILDAVQKFRDSLGGEMAPDEIDAVCAQQKEALQAELRKWCRAGEYVTIEINSLEGTATVINVT